MFVSLVSFLLISVVASNLGGYAAAEITNQDISAGYQELESLDRHHGGNGDQGLLGGVLGGGKKGKKGKKGKGGKKGKKGKKGKGGKGPDLGSIILPAAGGLAAGGLAATLAALLASGSIPGPAELADLIAQAGSVDNLLNLLQPAFDALSALITQLTSLLPFGY